MRKALPRDRSKMRRHETQKGGAEARSSRPRCILWYMPRARARRQLSSRANARTQHQANAKLHRAKLRFSLRIQLSTETTASEGAKASQPQRWRSCCYHRLTAAPAPALAAAVGSNGCGGAPAAAELPAPAEVPPCALSLLNLICSSDWMAVRQIGHLFD